MDLLAKRRIHFAIGIVSIIVLSLTAEKCRQMIGDEASSQSGQFTLLNCFDMGSGTVACGVKEGVKLYFYNIRAAHVERARHDAIETALVDALGQGMSPKEAALQAQKDGAKAAKLASRKAKRIIGPIISSGWDFFEAMYYGGTMTEGLLRGTGTLLGTYAGGFSGEQRLGRFGYLVGSHLGSWVGGRVGLMVYDVISGIEYLLYFTQPEETEPYRTLADDSSEPVENSYTNNESPVDMNSEATPEETEPHRTLADDSSEPVENSYTNDESPVDMNSEASEGTESFENSYGDESLESPAYESFITSEEAEL